MVNDEFKAFVKSELDKTRKNPTAQNIEKALGLAKLCIEEFKDREYALNEISKELKRIIIEDIYNSDIYTVLKFADHIRKNNQHYDEIEVLWNVLLFEGQNMNFDSYLLYLEKNREPDERFYFPKRKCFLKIGLIQALQDILDDKLDVLSISMPPGTGKLLADDTPVLTTKGWKNHGDLVVGDYVYGLDGKPKKVQYVFPKDKADCLITFTNGEQIQCHENHEWVVIDNKCGGIKTLETNELIKEIAFYDEIGTHSRWFLPKREKIESISNELYSISIKSIERVEPKQGNCIQVEDGIYCVGKTMLPTHNSTIEKFLHTAIMGWFPKEYNLFFSHSAGITRMYYDGVLSILTDNVEYTWQEIFPNAKVTNTNAKMEQINIGSYKPFPNLQTASVGSEMAGKVRASYLLLVDDMIGKIEEALNVNTLDKLWNIYSTDARQRKVTGCKELHIATRWSVKDVIGRLKDAYGDSDRCRFIAVPDIDIDTGKSNFEFDYNPFTVDFFNDQEKLMDEISYRCLYKNDPIEREGLLYEPSSTRTYITLPDREPDAILGVCDTKSTGKDYMVLTVFYQYDNDFYLVDCICDDSADFGEQQRRLSQIILDNNMQQCEFESNAGGSRLAVQVAELVNEQNGRCNITTKPTETNKETRIIVNSDWIKKNCLFKDKSLYATKTDYGRFMGFMYSYSVVGKNKFDDVVDCLANFSLFINSKYSRGATITAIQNPLRRRR